ncbi:MAG TPA: hypothetical protein DCG70_00275 [Lachnoclostridium sp.]|nr:hypothetical protein [Lachnoclostridium sp.]
MYMMKRDEEYLSASNVSIWVPIAEDADEEEQEERWNQVLESFKADYPVVGISLKLIPEEDYADELEEALDAGKAPALFMSTGLSAEYDSSLADLEDTLERLNRSDYYYMSEYERIYPEKNRLPMGFHVNTIYGNVILAEEGGALPAENDRAAFLEKKSMLFVGDTRDFYEMQENLRAVYSIVPPAEGEKLAVSFDTEWSVNEDADRKEKNAAKRILTYMMSPAGQQLLHIEEQNSLPMTKDQMEQYLTIYPQLSGLLENAESLPVVPSAEMESLKADLFKELITRDDMRERIAATEANQ